MADSFTSGAATAVCVRGATGWSMSINGEYIRTAALQDGRAVFRKADSSKVLAYKSSRRAWLVSRSLLGGSYAQCGGPDVLNPTDIESCTVGMAAHSVEVQDMPLPRELLVLGQVAQELGLEGTYCREEAPSIFPDFRRCDASGPPKGSISLAYQNGSWSFFRREREVGGARDAELSAPRCASDAVRPDRLISSCFGYSDAELSILPGGTGGVGRAAPLLELGGPELGPAAHLRGEYVRSGHHHGRAAYVKPGGSMRLFYSHDLGGWHVANSFAGGLAQQMDACALKVEDLQGTWQVLNHQGQMQEVPLALMARASPPWLSFTGWPAHLQMLQGDYHLLPDFDWLGRPSYALHVSQKDLGMLCVKSIISCASRKVAFAVVSSDSAWSVTLLGRRVAGADGGRWWPTGARHWHLTEGKRCRSVPSMRIMEEQLAPSAVLVFGWNGVLNAAVNGEYLRRTAPGRASYAKSDGSAELFYNEAEALWTIRRGSSALATCSRPHVRDPVRLPSCWNVAHFAAPALQIRALSPAVALMLEGNTSCDGVFELMGLWNRRPSYLERGLPASREPRGGPASCWLRSTTTRWHLGAGNTEVADEDHGTGSFSPEAGFAEAMRLEGGWRWRSLQAVAPLELRLRRVPVVGAKRLQVRGAQVLEGTYLRVEDHDGRAAYERLSGEKVSLRYSNLNGDWRFSAAAPGAAPRLLAFNGSVEVPAPEALRTWRIPLSSLRFEEVDLIITAWTPRSQRMIWPLLFLLCWPT
ncbi:unnamed protein product [Durusdinium trenchii]|uniref:Uncharacterized protein n=1 Tax=Durusdinium trenchii TaxID=1381693 RepID=A0ABP0QPA1_9DINO